MANLKGGYLIIDLNNIDIKINEGSNKLTIKGIYKKLYNSKGKIICLTNFKDSSALVHVYISIVESLNIPKNSNDLQINFRFGADDTGYYNRSMNIKEDDSITIQEPPY